MSTSKKKEQTEDIKKTNFLVYENKSLTKRMNEAFKTEDDIQNEKKFSSFLRENEVVEHPYEYEIVEGMTKKFALVNAILDKITDFIVGPGLNIKCEDENALQILEDFKIKNNVESYLQPFVKEALMKGPGYLEIAGISDKDKNTKIKNVGSNSMYIKKDDKGNIIGYAQYIGSKDLLSKRKIIPLSKDQIVMWNVNKIDSSPYGYGLVYSALSILNDFLGAQKALHKLAKRKANSPIHVAVGDIATQDFPEQSDLDAIGGKLQYMDETTEWVTGPNVKFNVLDFGNITDKVTGILDNDMKLLSYSFQVPESLLGGEKSFVGAVEMQMDAFERRIKAYQQSLGFVLKEQIFKRVLRNNGLDVDFTIEWGQQSEDDINKKLEVYKNILSVVTLSEGMKESIEEKIADLIEVDYEKVKKINEEKEAEDAEREEEEAQKLPVVPGVNSTESAKGIYKDILSHPLNLQEGGEILLKEWITFNYDEFKEDIISAIKKDEFNDLKALNEVEKNSGYLTQQQVNELKSILVDAFENNKSVNEIKKTLIERKTIPDLYSNGKLILNSDIRANLVARTETIRVSNLGALESYQKRGATQVRHITAISDRTCPECLGLNGHIYSLSEASTQIPVHVNCRCSTAPITELD